jgi:hypothetical protein
MAEAGSDEGLTSGDQRLCHGLGLRPFRTLVDLELDLVTFIQGLIARLDNRRVMDEDIRPVVLCDESKPFVGIKLLHGTIGHGMILLAWNGTEAATHERRISKKNRTRPCSRRCGPLIPHEHLVQLATERH